MSSCEVKALRGAGESKLVRTEEAVCGQCVYVNVCVCACGATSV